MRPGNVLTLWTGRLCLGLVGSFGLMGYHFGNVRFAPIAVGFALLAAVCYAEHRRHRV